VWIGEQVDVVMRKLGPGGDGVRLGVKFWDGKDAARREGGVRVGS